MLSVFCKYLNKQELVASCGIFCHDKPGINLFRWQWNYSRDVEPLAPICFLEPPHPCLWFQFPCRAGQLEGPEYRWRAASGHSRCAAFLLQCCSSSSLLMWRSSSISVIAGQPCWVSCSLLALLSRVRSPASHSKIQDDNLAIKVGYNWWASEVHPTARRCIKCQMSRRTMTSLIGHVWWHCPIRH